MAALNIKNEETYQLVRELTSITGESLTQAVTESVRERLDRKRDALERDERKAYWLRKGRENRERIHDLVPSTEISDFLYDEYGLPK